MYPVWAEGGSLAPLMPAPFIAAECLLPVHPSIPGSGTRGWLQENINPAERNGWRTPLWSGDIPGEVIQSTQWEPRGAQGKGSGGVWEVSFPPRIISHKLCQLSAVKQILEISTFPIWGERQHQLPSVLLSWELPQSVRQDRLGFFLNVRRRKFALKTNIHSPACNATPGSNCPLHPSAC